MIRKILFLSTSILFVICFALAGCPKVEKDAYLAAHGAKAFLDSLKAQHPECSTTNNEICEYIRKATAAKDALIDAGEVYCSSSSFSNGGACNPPDKKSPGYQQAQDKLRAALQNYEQIEKDLKAIVAKGAS